MFNNKKDNIQLHLVDYIVVLHINHVVFGSVNAVVQLIVSKVHVENEVITNNNQPTWMCPLRLFIDIWWDFQQNNKWDAQNIILGIFDAEADLILSTKRYTFLYWNVPNNPPVKTGIDRDKIGKSPSHARVWTITIRGDQVLKE